MTKGRPTDLPEIQANSAVALAISSLQAEVSGLRKDVEALLDRTLQQDRMIGEIENYLGFAPGSIAKAARAN